MQVTLAMMIGQSTSFLGIFAAWFGLTEESTVEGTAKDISANVAAAGSDVILGVCSTILGYTCISREFTYQSFEPVPTAAPIASQNENTT